MVEIDRSPRTLPPKGNYAPRRFVSSPELMTTSILPRLARFVATAAAASAFALAAQAQCPAWTIEALVPQFDDHLGSAVAGEGGTWVVGVPGHFGQGQALVFDATATGAVQTGLLWPNDLSSQDGFGSAVAIHGDVIAVGVPGDDDTTFGAGSVYVFERFFGVWLQTAKLQAAVPSASASFGSAVATGDGWIAVGAPFDSSAAPFTGRISLFQKTQSGWVLRQEESGTAPFERYGTSLAIHGGTMAVGAPGSGTGRVELFDAALWKWLPGPTLFPTGASSAAEFGCAVDVFANRVLVGARSDETDAPGAGAAYLFANTGAGWTQRQRFSPLTPAINDRFGASVGVGDEWMLVGSPGDDVAALDGGSAHLFVESATQTGGFVAWEEKSIITPLGAQAGVGFGDTLGVDGFRLWIGAPDEDTQAGDAGRVFAYTMSEVGCASLAVGPQEVSAQSPTTLEFSLNAGAALGGLPYFLLGSASGSATPTMVGGLPLPLVLPDTYGDLLLFGANTSPVPNNIGFLDADGHASVSIDLASLGYPLVQGAILSHAYFVFSGGLSLFVSEPATVEVLF
jgi:hypothetical protein